MRKLKYYIATTVDGFIAHRDGRQDGFLMQGDHEGDFYDSIGDFDTVLMGRETYDFGRKLGVTSPYPSLAQYVFSRTLREQPDPQVELVSTDAAAHVRKLKARAGKDIWLCGGGNLASGLLADGLIDEIIVKVNPVVFGHGKPLFGGRAAPTPLTLHEEKSFRTGVVVLRYRVAGATVHAQ